MRSIEREAPDVDSHASLLSRVFTIFNAFDSTEASISLSELSRRTNLPKSTVHRITGSLVDWGALRKTTSGFQLGMRLFELGGLVPLQSTIREAALPFMGDLYEMARETVHLGILDGTEVVYLDKIGGHRAVRVPSRIGGRMPAHCVGLGKAMLAFSSPATIDRVIAEGLPRKTPYTVTAPAVFLEMLRTIRKTGLAYDREESVLGVCCVAAPILDAGGAPVAAISVTAPTSRLEPERFAPAVRAAAISLSRTLGRRAVVSQSA